MSSTIVRNLEEFCKPSSKAEISEYSNRSFFGNDRAFKSVFEASFMIDQENAKQLEKIEKKAQELREKEKRQRNILKKLRKIYEQQLKEFEQLDRVTKQAIEQKSRQVQMLTIENTQLKEESIQFSTLKDEKQLLTLKNEQLQTETNRLFQELASLQQNYRSLKVQFEQQAELLEKGIKENQIESESSGFAVPGPLQEVEQLTRDFEEQRKKQFDTAIKKDEQNLKVQTQKINNCNFMLESLLKQIKKTEKERQSQDEVLQDKIIKSEHKLMTLTDELMKKTEELSQALGNSQKLQKDLKERQASLANLTYQLQQVKHQCESHKIEIETCKHEIEIYQDSQKMRLETQFKNRENTSKNFENFHEKLQQLLDDKKLKQYTTVYDLFSSTVNEVFKVWNLKMISGSNSGEKFIENVMKIVENSLINLNDYFRQKSSLDVERVQKMVGFIHNANNLLQKRNQDEQYIQKDEDRDIFVGSTPERFQTNPITQDSHHRQESESSAKSNKRSILLEQDMDNAINYEEEMERMKEQSLQEELSSMKNSQVILDSLKEGSEKSETVKDALSESSFSKSKFSQLSQAQQNKIYTENKKNALLKGKLKKKKKN